MYMVWFLSLKGIFPWECMCVCLRRWTLSHRQRFQCFLLIQTWTRVHFFLCTNYSSFFSVGILHMPAAHCHSKARCTFFSVHTNQLFLAATNFSCSCLSLNSWQPALIFRVKRHPQMSQYVHHLKRENFYMGYMVFVIIFTHFLGWGLRRWRKMGTSL